MNNLKIINVVVLDSSHIEITFAEKLVTNLITSNVSIIANTPGSPDSDILEIKILNKTLSIVCQPLTPLSDYFIVLQSVLPLHPFQSINGTSRLVEDGVSNKYLITAPLDTNNPVKNYLDTYYHGNIYNHQDNNTVIAKFIQSLAVNLSKALYDIRQVKNENYLNVNIVDEFKTRGSGAFDRLSEEGAYEIVRAGRTPTGSSVSNKFVFETFPTYPVTLQKNESIEVLTSDSVNEAGLFNINGLILNVDHTLVTKVTSIVFTLNSVDPIYTYDIERYGYQITNSRYDQDYAFSYAQLETNQIKLNDEILQDPLFLLNQIIRVEVNYEFKNQGVVLDATTVTVYNVETAVREVLPPIINVFNLKHAPIVGSNNEIPTIEGIVFIDPNAEPGSLHPAFKYEIPYRLDSLPAMPGQYAIDYSTATVYVYGSSIINDGTGPYPPLATYQYRLTYQSEIDYVYDQDFLDLVALPNGSLIDMPGSIAFNYEEVFVPNVDYEAKIHLEELSERIDNRLVALNVFKTLNSPITNVFRIYNETSGEIYTLDRWNNDKVYFRYNTPPRILLQDGERAVFETIINELLFVDSILNNTLSQRIFKILLDNNAIVASTEDCLASSFNTSLNFSSVDIFNTEKWYTREFTVQANIERLTDVGEYMIDYENGIIYCSVSTSQDFNIGTASYKYKNIIPTFPHVISTEDIYYRISRLNPKNKTFNVLSSGNDSIIPETLDYSDELFLNNTNTSPYQLYNNTVGSFVSTNFVAGVTNQVNFVRSIYEYDDLRNSTAPYNFAIAATPNAFDISVDSVTKQVFESVQYDGLDYYVNINENLPYISPNITYTFSIIRTSDLAQLWDSSGVIEEGDPVKLILSGVNSPQVDDQVNIIYTFNINNLARIVVDYNKGEYYIDYNYLADEIIVSYEYGDNVLDFRRSTVPSGTDYYVSYKAGALRDALLKNFGTLVNVPELSVFDTDFNRERYRDALSAALTSFIQGPTVVAIKNIGKTISHIEPEITESAFINWSLGNSLLYPEDIKTTGEFQLLPAKYGNGVLIDNDQTITLPVNSNIRLEDGTFETWVIPQWNGLDNDADLTFSILKDGYAISADQIFIGASEYHPSLLNNTFVVNKDSNVSGIPNLNKDGVFIYYDEDTSGSFNRWYVRVIDGYVDPISSSYRFTISSDGTFYDSKSTVLPATGLTITTSNNTLKFNVTGGVPLDKCVTFLSDLDKYLLDFGESKNRNRLSIYKDSSGYINLKVFDKNKTSYTISSDASNWQAGELHHIAASWKLNTRNSRDEMHLFIDGFEVPNIIKYGNKLQPYLHEKFRTVNPEEIVGLVDRDIIGSTDLVATLGDNVVSSSINFSAYNISPGDIIFIDETGFALTGYSIVSISGQELTLNTIMPATITNGHFSINRTQFTVTSEIDIAANIAVSTMHPFLDGYDMVGSIGSNIVTSALTNFITEDVEPGYLLRIDNLLLSTTYVIVAVGSNSLTLDEDIVINFSSGVFQVYTTEEVEIPGVRAVRPAYSISKNSSFENILTVSNDVFAGDLIIIRTLGLNYRKVKKQYYVWSDDQENILMTQMPAPIALDEVKINKIIIPIVAIGPSNSTLTLGQFVSDNIPGMFASNSQDGRTLSISISGTNVDFIDQVEVNINGTVGMSTVTETILFSDYGTLDSVNRFIEVNYINVTVTPVNTSRNALTIIVKEKYSITHSESSALFPIIRYSYSMGAGYTLYDDGYGIVRDNNFQFSGLDVGNYLVINSPASVAGFYTINGVSEDRHALLIDPTNQSMPLPLANFSNGIYQILNTNSNRSGLQNGFFTFEDGYLPGQPYYLNHGFYELEYYTYAKIQLDPITSSVFIGSDFNSQNQINSIVDETKIYSTMLTDTRVGETIPSNQRSITKDFNSLKALKADINTLVLLTYDEFPFENNAKFYIRSNENNQHFQSSITINENFDNSIVLLDKPIHLVNEGILDTKKEGTVEFWMSPFFDTSNDPIDRYYFDAYGAVIEETVSVNNTAVKISAPASQILSVKLKAGDSRIDYFAGGKLEIDTQRATQEEGTSIANSSVVVSKPILQVITVKILGDATGADYFTDGSIGTDQKTIYLGKILPDNNLPLIITYQSTENKNNTLNTQVIRLNRKLPYQNTTVVVNYIPQGLQGDRLSIFKDKSGYMNFTINASGTEYSVRAPVLWPKNSWHRVKASYKVNGNIGQDEMRLFLDGYEFSNVTLGDNIFFGNFPMIFGGAIPGGPFTVDGYTSIKNINFKDPINDLFIGTQYSGESPAFTLMDNFRISDVSRPIYAPYGEPLDVNYNSNLNVVFPVTEDLFTTYLMNFDQTVFVNDDFAVLKNRNTGSFDFTVDIQDALDIVSSNIKSKEALEALIKTLKPANSRVFITYTS